MGPSPPTSPWPTPPPPEPDAPRAHASPYPLDLGRIVALGWSLVKHAWPVLLGTAALCLVPAYILMAAFAGVLGPSVNRWYAEVGAATLAGRPAPAPPSGLEVAIIVLVGAGLLLFLASTVAGAALVMVVDGTFRGGRPRPAGSVRGAIRRLPSLIAAQILLFLIVILIVVVGTSLTVPLLIGGGLPAFIGLVIAVGSFAAVMFVFVRTSLLVPSIVLEGTGGAEGLARSWRLTAGSGWRVLGYLLLGALLIGLIGLLIGGVPALLLNLSGTQSAHVVASTALEAVTAIVLAPITPLALTLLYHDLRWRHGQPTPLPGTDEPAAPPALLRP